MGAVFAWPKRAAARPSRRSERALALGLGLAAATAVAIVLPPQVFRAQAVVLTADPTSPLATFLPRTAAEVAVSKPVMQRAAESLIGTGLEAPEPDLVERLAIAASVGSARATGKAARLAADLSRNVSAVPGAFPGSLELFATSDDAERAAQIVATVAEALLAEQGDSIVKLRRVREAEMAGRVDRLRADASTAQRRLASLGGVAAEPEQARATAAAQTATARARVETIKSIFASGMPPLSDRRDVPTAIETLQASYLDLSRQLAKARETLGDRHTTIISLQAEVKHAATSLTAEWRRLGKLAEGELAAARDREASLRKSDTPADANRRTAIEEARRAVQAAEDAVARAKVDTGTGLGDERSYRLLSRPAVPLVPIGISPPLRALLAMLSGLLGFGLFGALWRRRPSVAVWRKRSEPVVDLPLREDGPDGEDEVPVVPKPAERSKIRRRPARQAPSSEAAASEELVAAMDNVLPALDEIVPAFGAVPTIIVTANEPEVGTTPAALALGRAAAARGQRTLLVEAARPRPELAASASDDAEPVLLDLFGTLRVGLRAEIESGCLYLAPSLEQGARIASALARGRETPIIDDIESEFDLIVIDGGEAEACAEAGWGADAYLRVGLSASRRDDVVLAATFDVPCEMIVGTFVSARFRKARHRSLEKTTVRAMPVAARAAHQVHAGGPSSAARARSASPLSPRRRIGAR